MHSLAMLRANDLFGVPGLDCEGESFHTVNYLVYRRSVCV